LKTLVLLSPVLSSLTLTFAFAQTPPPPPVHSPDVQPGGRVTFRLRAPSAQKVTVSLEGSKGPLAMQKDEQGVWSVTTDPLAPDMYGYSFEADGVRIVDSVNTEIKPNLLSLSNVVHVPGPTPDLWDQTDIPHGQLHHHFYRSAVVGDNRDFYVYTPPAYDPSASTRYPVLYLLHGFSDDASGWSAVGKANLIMDALIAQNKSKPMIVVMTLGYGAPEYVSRNRAPNDQALRDKNINNFRDALIGEVLPAVERAYKVDASRDSRAIAGLSMGGAETLLIGLNRLDKFSWVASFSAGGVGEDFAKAFPNLTAEANSQLHLLWVACGTEDRLITPNRKFVEFVKSKGVNVTPIETPGMHTWMVWRRNLATVAPLLFQSTRPGGTQ
jgi:enterochelin esterase-like enzyme